MSTLVRVGLIHTVASLTPVFDSLLLARRPDLSPLHLCDASMLTRAIERGQADRDILGDLRAHSEHLLNAGVSRILVTCSSLGALADLLSRDEGLPVERIDRAMAHQAVSLAGPCGHITVLATQPSTLKPTGDLIKEARCERLCTLAACGSDGETGRVSGPEIVTHLIEGAAQARAGGDLTEHDRLIRAAVAHAQCTANVVVLAQASMASALDNDGEKSPVPILTSPVSGVEHFVSHLPDVCESSAK